MTAAPGFDRIVEIFQQYGADKMAEAERRWREEFPDAADNEIRNWADRCLQLAERAKSQVVRVKQGTIGLYWAARELRKWYPDLAEARLMEVVRRAYRGARGPILEQDVDPPLADLIEACAIYCQVDCCGTNALAVRDDLMRPWIKWVGSATALRAKHQLKALLASVEEHEGPVLCRTGFYQEWDSAQECATYLGVWLVELNTALGASPEGEHVRQRDRPGEGW